MLQNLTKRWDLCCDEHGCTNLNNANPNIYFSESMSLFKGNSTIGFDYKPNEQRKNFWDRHF